MNERALKPPGWEAGAIIGDRYRIAGVLGRGGMGVVYAAEDMKLQGKLRAVKATRVNPNDWQRHSDEAQVLMKLNHPHLPLIIDYYPADEQGVEWFVMDFISGQTLQSLVVRPRDRRRADFASFVRIAMQLCSALEYMHGQTPPIIHRDLKPSNVMIDENGHVRLIDFGIARQFKAGGGQDTVLLGTPGFAAPEQEGGGQSGVWTDVYGLGALLYYLLSGGEYYARTDTDRLSGLWRRIGAPRSFGAVLARMLHERPEKRYGSMAEVMKALAAFLPEQASDSEGEGRSYETPRGVGLTVSVVALSPGAGATFLTITIASLLARSGIPCAAAEFPEARPEWHALLPAATSGRTAFRRTGGDRAHPSPDSRYTVLENGNLWRCMLRPGVPSSPDSEDKFRLMLEDVPASVRLIDLSADWQGKAAARWLRGAGILLIVADPFVSRWDAGRLASLGKLGEERIRAGLPTLWIANKDVPFRRREEWHGLLPSRPGAVFPLLPASEVLSAIWEGGWIDESPKLVRLAARALQPVTGTIERELRTNMGRV